MTFEQKYKDFLKNDFETILGDNFNVLITNDLSFRNYQKGDILTIIKTGQGTTSGVENVLAVNTVTTITFLCESIYLQDILARLNDYVNQVNGKYYDFGDGVLVKLGLNTPYVIGSPNITNVGNDSIYTSVCQIVGNIFYSDLAAPKKKYIYFGAEPENIVEIEGIQSFQDNSTYNYTYSDTQDLYGKQLFNGVSRSFTCQIYLKNNEISKKLNSVILYNKTYAFQIGGEFDADGNLTGGDELLEVIFESKTKIESNGVGILSFVMTVVGDFNG